MIEFKVYGAPGPQGSKRHVGKGVMVESSKKVAPWREAVKWAVIPTGLKATPGLPLSLEVTFTLAKPQSAPRNRRTWPMRKPDLDKLIRSTMDALTESGVWEDDARVILITAAKCFPGEGYQSLSAPGAWIKIQEINPQ